MKSKIVIGFVLAACVMLTGCEKKSENVSDSFNLSDGLRDCAIHKLQSSSGKTLYVVRCPLSETTTYRASDKIKTNVSVVETSEISLNGKTYVEKKQ